MCGGVGDQCVCVCVGGGGGGVERRGFKSTSRGGWTMGVLGGLMKGEGG